MEEQVEASEAGKAGPGTVEEELVERGEGWEVPEGALVDLEEKGLEVV